MFAQCVFIVCGSEVYKDMCVCVCGVCLDAGVWQAVCFEEVEAEAETETEAGLQLFEHDLITRQVSEAASDWNLRMPQKLERTLSGAAKLGA